MIAAALLLLVVALFSPVASAGPMLNQIQPLFKRPIQKAAVITINGEIDDVTYSSIKRRVLAAERAGCTLIIYRLNTYGGLLTSALNISKYTKSIGIPVVAYVDTKAYSAGSLIATSCKYIVMAPGAAIGDCEPIAIANGAMHQPSNYIKAKIMSPLLEEFANSARRNGYDPLLLEGMVLRHLRIEEVRDAITHERRFVTVPQRKKLLALGVKQPSGAVLHPWRFVREVKPNGQLLTVDTAQALRLGLARARIQNPEQLRAALNIVGGNVPVMRLDWAEHLTRWVAGTFVRFGLFLVMLVCGYIELTHPGFIIPGIIAVICLGLLVGGPFLTGLAHWWEILVILIGLSVVVFDFIFYGGIGLLAIPGFILMAVGIVASFIPSTPGHSFISSAPQTLGALQTGLSVVIFGTATAIAVLFAIARYLPATPGLKHLQVAPAAHSSANRGPLNALSQPVRENVFPNAIGLALSDLRPSGRAKFDTDLVNVITDGQFIRQNTEVRVVEIRGNQVVVKPHTPPAGLEPA